MMYYAVCVVCCCVFLILCIYMGFVMYLCVGRDISGIVMCMLCACVCCVMTDQCVCVLCCVKCCCVMCLVCA